MLFFVTVHLTNHQWMIINVFILLITLNKQTNLQIAFFVLGQVRWALKLSVLWLISASSASRWPLKKASTLDSISLSVASSCCLCCVLCLSPIRKLVSRAPITNALLLKYPSKKLQGKTCLLYLRNVIVTYMSTYNPVGLLGLGPLHVNRCINIQP